MSKPLPEETDVFSLRLETGLIDKLDIAAEHQSKPGLKVTRADVIRMAIHEWLAAHEKKGGGGR